MAHQSQPVARVLTFVYIESILKIPIASDAVHQVDRPTDLSLVPIISNQCCQGVGFLLLFEGVGEFHIVHKGLIAEQSLKDVVMGFYLFEQGKAALKGQSKHRLYDRQACTQP
jgi:hypothetical protein